MPAVFLHTHKNVWQVLLRLLGATHMMGLKLKPASETSRPACGLVKGSPGYFSTKSIMFDVASWIIEIQELQFPKKKDP